MSFTRYNTFQAVTILQEITGTGFEAGASGRGAVLDMKAVLDLKVFLVPSATGNYSLDLQLREPSGTYYQIFFCKHILQTYFIVLQHNYYEVDPRDSVLQAPESNTPPRHQIPDSVSKTYQ